MGPKRKLQLRRIQLAPVKKTGRFHHKTQYDAIKKKYVGVERGTRIVIDRLRTDN